MKILILKPSSLGDVVQALPVARLLKCHFPSAKIDWWLNRELAPLLEGDPDIDQILPFDRRLWGRPEGWLLAVSQIRKLRREHYDWILDLQSLARSAAVGWLAQGELLIGLDDRREGAPALYDIAVPRASPQTHAVDWYLAALHPLNIPVHWNFDWIPLRPDAAASVQARAGDPEDRWIALQPGARWDNKRWPVSHFARLAAGLIAYHPRWKVAILGGPMDRAMGATIAGHAGNRCLDLTGRLTLPEMTEWIRRCSLMVTNDTGPMHVAAALGRPVIGIFGPTAPARTGPYGQLEHILRVPLPCAPCLKSSCHFEEPMACLRRLAPERVLEAAIARMEGILSLPCPAAPGP